MERFYLIGEPVMSVFGDLGKDEFFLPAGQADASIKVLKETREPEIVRQKLREEYLAIVFAL